MLLYLDRPWFRTASKKMKLLRHWFTPTPSSHLSTSVQECIPPHVDRDPTSTESRLEHKIATQFTHIRYRSTSLLQAVQGFKTHKNLPHPLVGTTNSSRVPKSSTLQPRIAPHTSLTTRSGHQRAPSFDRLLLLLAILLHTYRRHVLKSDSTRTESQIPSEGVRRRRGASSAASEHRIWRSLTAQQWAGNR